MILTERENEILLRLQSRKDNCIFGFMFGDPVYTAMNPDGTVAFTEPDHIISMPVSDLEILSEQGEFLYAWGWPGPDMTLYKITDYGRTWAFTKEELEVRT